MLQLFSKLLEPGSIHLRYATHDKGRKTPCFVRCPRPPGPWAPS
jgi:hypothetical protein